MTKGVFFLYTHSADRLNEPDDHQDPPAMLERHPKARKVVTLLSGVSIALSAGTNYAFSIYAVQLGQKLDLSSMALNVIGLGGNLGMYISSPLVGRVIDGHGSTIPLLAAALLISMGYGLLWLLYLKPTLPLIVVQTFVGNVLVGLGSSIANSCAVTGTASVFEATHRATAIGTVLAGFGLSAFFWTAIGSYIAKSDTAVLLALWSVGPSLAILLGGLGYFLAGLKHHHVHKDSVYHSDSHREQDPHPSSSSSHSPRQDAGEATRLLFLRGKTQVVDITGWELAKEWDFWMIFMVMSCCCGIGLMMINNLGTMLVALYGAGGTDETVRQYQAHGVSVLSLFNCFGRVFAGTVSDQLKRGLSVGRVWWLSWISCLFLLSQMVGYYVVESMDQVVWLGALVGFSYGNMYGTGPALILEWFGLAHFGTNFGLLNLAPLVCGQLFNLSFGRIFDSHSHPDQGLLCLERQGCYDSVFLITICGAFLSLLVSIWLAFRRPEFHRIKTEDHEAEPFIH